MVGPLTVLVVEDNADGRAALCALLRRVGYTVEEAADGPEGLAKGVALRPGVALVDIGLPGLDGYEVVRELRRNPATARARMIAVTGYGGDQERARSREAGFDAHLTKPADPTTLHELLAASASAN